MAVACLCVAVCVAARCRYRPIVQALLQRKFHAVKALLSPLHVIEPSVAEERRSTRTPSRRMSRVFNTANEVRDRMLMFVRVGLVDTFEFIRGDPKGRTVLDLAAEWGNADVFRYLLRYNQGFEYMGSGESSQLPAQVKPTALQVRCGCGWATESAPRSARECQITDIEGRTILHRICRRKKELPEIVRLLLNARINVNICDKFGNSALHYAVANGHAEIAELLIRYSANLEKENAVGATPLHLACKFGRLGVASILVKHGASFTASDHDGRSPLHYAYLERYAKRNLTQALHQLMAMLHEESARHLGDSGRPRMSEEAKTQCVFSCCVAIDHHNADAARVVSSTVDCVLPIGRCELTLHAALVAGLG